MDIFVVLVPPVSLWSSLLNLVVQGNYFQPKISIKNIQHSKLLVSSAPWVVHCVENTDGENTWTDYKEQSILVEGDGIWHHSGTKIQAKRDIYTLMKYIFCFSKDRRFLGLEDTLNIF